MAKYRGKYKKSRTCIHAICVHMVLVEAKDTCPKAVKFSSGLMTDKYICEQCEHYKEDKQDGEIQSTDSQ